MAPNMLTRLTTAKKKFGMFRFSTGKQEIKNQGTKAPEYRQKTIDARGRIAKVEKKMMGWGGDVGVGKV